jgi:hypothetical protein
MYSLFFSDFFEDMRNGSTTLYDKTVGLVTGLRQTVAQLSPSARAFVDQVFEAIKLHCLPFLSRWSKSMRQGVNNLGWT